MEVPDDTSGLAMPPAPGKLFKYHRSPNAGKDLSASTPGSGGPPPVPTYLSSQSDASIPISASLPYPSLRQAQYPHIPHPASSAPPDPGQASQIPTDTLTVETDPQPAQILSEWTSHPRHPRNWSNARKWKITITVAFTGFISTLGSSIAVPGVHAIMADFGVESSKVGVLITTFYVLGMG